jgi:hypothetical protein
MNHLPGGDGVFARLPYLRYIHTLVVTIEISQCNRSLSLCCLACTVRTKLPFLAILVRVSFGKIFGLDILT